MEIKSLKQANKLLAAYVPLVKELLGKDVTLMRIKPLMKLLGNPQDQIKIIHVAGTSGKTSTAYYIASLLHASGLKVGLTVSPHLDSVTERVQINLKPLPEAEFCQALGEFLELIKPAELTPTYFELLVAFAYWYFAKTGVDYAVIETGLGGLHDGTNIAGLANKVCVITDIGYDHMQILGHKLSDIAAQKAGIIKPKNQVFMYKQAAEINEVFDLAAKEQSAKLNTLSESEERANMMVPNLLARLPVYQQRNWLLAYKVSEYIRARDDLSAPSWKGLSLAIGLQVPGRMEITKVGDKTLVMDGAHNEQKMQAFVTSFQQFYPGSHAAILLAMKEGKEYESVLPLLQPICSELIITTFDVIQDLPTHSIKPQTLAAAARSAGINKVTIEPDSKIAFNTLIQTPNKLLIVTGSFYLISVVRSIA